MIGKVVKRLKSHKIFGVYKGGRNVYNKSSE